MPWGALPHIWWVVPLAPPNTHSFPDQHLIEF